MVGDWLDMHSYKITYSGLYANPKKRTPPSSYDAILLMIFDKLQSVKKNMYFSNHEKYLSNATNKEVAVHVLVLFYPQF